MKKNINLDIQQYRYMLTQTRFLCCFIIPILPKFDIRSRGKLDLRVDLTVSQHYSLLLPRLPNFLSAAFVLLMLNSPHIKHPDPNVVTVVPSKLLLSDRLMLSPVQSNKTAPYRQTLSAYNQ